MREELNRILVHHTGQSMEKIQRDTDRDFFMTAEQAKEYGIVDEVISSKPTPRPVPEVAVTAAAGVGGGPMARTREGGGVAEVLVLRQEPERRPQADRGAHRLHLRRVHRALQRHHRGGVGGGEEPGAPQPPQARRDQERPRPVRDRPGAGQEDPRGRRPQPLQAHRGGQRGGRRRAAEGQHPPDRPHRLRQDAPRPDARQDPPRALHHRRRHHAHRGRLRRRGRGEHHPAAAPGGGLRRRAGAAGHRLHRRDRQDRAQVARTRRSRATSPARACSRRCSRSSRARSPTCRPRAGASTRTRSSSRSTPPTSCSSAAAPSSASTRSSRAAWARPAMGFGAEIKSREDRRIGDLLAMVQPEDLLKYGLIPEFVGRLPGGRHAPRPGRGGARADPQRAEERHRQAVPEVLRPREGAAQVHRRRGGRGGPRGDEARHGRARAPRACSRRSCSR